MRLAFYAKVYICAHNCIETWRHLHLLRADINRPELMDSVSIRSALFNWLLDAMDLQNLPTAVACLDVWTYQRFELCSRIWGLKIDCWFDWINLMQTESWRKLNILLIMRISPTFHLAENQSNCKQVHERETQSRC